MKRLYYSFITVSLSLGIISCKSAYTKIGSKDANYIPYYLKVYEADSLFIVGNYKKSYEILNELFKKYEPINMDNFVEYGTYLNAAVKSNNIKDFRNKVKKGYLFFGGITSTVENSYDLQMEVNKVAGLTEVEITELKIQYYNNLNVQLRQRMIQMYKNDQNARLINPTKEKMNSVDEINRVELNEIFNKFEFPKKSLIGSNNAWDILDSEVIYIGVLFLHQADSIRAKFLPMLFNAVKKGYLEPQVYGVVYDRDLILKNDKQFYGNYSEADGKLSPVINLHKIDSIRKNIGLFSLKYMQWRANFRHVIEYEY